MIIIGNNWLNEIIFWFLYNKLDLDYLLVKIFLDYVEDLESINLIFFLRVIMLYFFFWYFLKDYIKNGGKIVYIIRNFKDVVFVVFYYYK